MKPLYRFYFFATMSLFFSSCFPGYYDPYYIPEASQKENIFYAPPSANAPLLKEKNDLILIAKFVTGPRHNVLDLQTAYLPNKHIGIAAGISTGDAGKYKNYELSAGYITKLDSFWHFELYSGFGSGSIANLHATGGSNVKNNYYFLQPSFGVSNLSKSLQMGFVSKIIFTKFSVTDTTFSGAREAYTANQIKLLYSKPWQTFLQPGIVLRVGWENFTIETSYHASFNLSSKELNYASSIFSIGTQLKLNLKK